MTTIAPQAEAQRTAVLLGVHHHRVGQIAAYRGEPSWVFMNIEGSAYDGKAVCKLVAHNGATVASGTFEVDNGSGQFARALRVDIDRLRRAEVITQTGATVATAIFS
jgi:hypothetical protein